MYNTASVEHCVFVIYKKGEILRNRTTGELFRIVGVQLKFNSGAGGALYHLKSVDDPSRQDTVLIDGYGNSMRYEPADGLERAVVKASETE